MSVPKTANDIPLRDLLARARAEQARLKASDPGAPRFHNSEAYGLARMDAVVDWLSRVPVCEWTDEYLERPRTRQ